MRHKTSRRAFLKRTAGMAMAAGVPLGMGARAGAAPPPSEKINIALIGAGNMGRYHLNAMLAEPACSIVAICDCQQAQLDQARAVVNLPEKDFLRDFREVLARRDVDAVNIATPDHWHVPLALRAIRAGKAVYVQKPLSMSIGEGRFFANAVRRMGAIVQVGSQQRSAGNFRFACELVRNGYIGRIEHIEVDLPPSYGPQPGVMPPQPVPEGFDYDMWVGPAPMKPYTFERVVHFRGAMDYAGGYFNDWGAHHFDIVQWALGRDDSGPVRVEGRGEYLKEGIMDAAMAWDVTYTYDDGVTMHARVGEHEGIRFHGESGTIYVNRQRMDADPASLLRTTLLPGEVHLQQSRGHLANFFEAVRHQRDPLTTTEIGHRSATICHLGNIAMLLGRPLDWDPVNEQFIGDAEANRMVNRTYRAPWGLV